MADFDPQTISKMAKIGHFGPLGAHFDLKNGQKWPKMALFDLFWSILGSK
jgi:hypothetical protein